MSETRANGHAIDAEDEFTLPDLPKKPRFLPAQPRQKSAGLSALPPGEVSSMLVRQALDTLPHRLEVGDRIDGSNKAATISMMEAIEPKDAIEGMLVTQMVGMHNLAMDRMKRAQFVTGPEREAALQQANKASRTFGMLVEVLGKHRNKGQSKMIVEHVHVHPGAQAIVGHVETRTGGDVEK